MLEEPPRQAQARPQRPAALPPNQQQLEKQEYEFKKNLSIPTTMALPFLALNHYDALYMLVYLVIAISLLAYKNIIYPLPGYAVACEGIMLAMLALTQLLRYLLAKQGVKNKQANYIGLYLVGSVFVMLTLIFELRLQTYVILIEIITNSVGLFLVGVEFFVGIWVLRILQHKKQNT